MVGGKRKFVMKALKPGFIFGFAIFVLTTLAWLLL